MVVKCGINCGINGGVDCDILSEAVRDRWIESDSVCSLRSNGGESVGLIVGLIVGSTVVSTVIF